MPPDHSTASEISAAGLYNFLELNDSVVGTSSKPDRSSFLQNKTLFSIRCLAPHKSRLKSFPQLRDRPSFKYHPLNSLKSKAAVRLRRGTKFGACFSVLLSILAIGPSRSRPLVHIRRIPPIPCQRFELSPVSRLGHPHLDRFWRSPFTNPVFSGPSPAEVSLWR